MSIRTTSRTTIVGVGRKDYSQSIEYSVENAIRSLQERFFYSNSYTALDALAYPDVYEVPLQFLVGDTLQNTAPTNKPWMFYLVEATTNTNNLAIIAFNRYSSYNDYLLGNITEYLGSNLGYVEAKVEYTKGVATIPGSVYSIQFGVFSGNPFDIEIVLHGLVGGEDAI